MRKDDQHVHRILLEDFGLYNKPSRRSFNAMTMNSTAQLASSFLFLPADRLERLPKALGSGAHMVVLDLEDGVALDSKALAREALEKAWSTLDANVLTRIALRINSQSSSLQEEDLLLLRRLTAVGLGAVIVPKVESAAELKAVSLYAANTPLIALVESAEGLSRMTSFASGRRVYRLAFGHLDFQLDLGMHCDADERELDAARFQFVAASRRSGLPPPIDGITVVLQNEDRLRQDCQRSRRFGFGGKLCIHPSQVALVNQSFEATAADVAWATRVLAAAETEGTGAFRFEGGMVDAPVLARARRCLDSMQDRPRT